MLWISPAFPGFLRNAEPPEVDFDGFYPLVPFVIGVESPEYAYRNPYPVSTAQTAADIQRRMGEMLRSQEVLVSSSIPRFMVEQGILDESTASNLRNAKPGDVVQVNLPAGKSIKDVVIAFPVPEYNPQLFGIERYLQLLQLVAGFELGGADDAGSATAASLNASNSSRYQQYLATLIDGSTALVIQTAIKAVMWTFTPEDVERIAGRGAAVRWPRGDEKLFINQDLAVRVIAGSTGALNKAEIASALAQLTPLLMGNPAVDAAKVVEMSAHALGVDPKDLVNTQTPSPLAESNIQQQQAAAAMDPVEAPEGVPGESNTGEVADTSQDATASDMGGGIVIQPDGGPSAYMMGA